MSVEGVLVVREGGKNTIRALPSYPTEPTNALRWAGGSSWGVPSLHLYVHPLKGEKRLRRNKNYSLIFHLLCWSSYWHNSMFENNRQDELPDARMGTLELLSSMRLWWHEWIKVGPWTERRSKLIMWRCTDVYHPCPLATVIPDQSIKHRRGCVTWWFTIKPLWCWWKHFHWFFKDLYPSSLDDEMNAIDQNALMSQDVLK